VLGTKCCALKIYMSRNNITVRLSRPDGPAVLGTTPEMATLAVTSGMLCPDNTGHA